MGYETRISTKGQIVLPKAMRDRLAWETGMTLEMVEHPDGIMLVPKVGEADPAATERVLTRIRKLNTYRGPRISDENIDQAMTEMAAARYDSFQ